MNTIIYIYPNGKKEKLYRNICNTCNKETFVKKYRLGQRCQKCAGKAVGLLNLGRQGPNLGKEFSNETKLKMSQAKQGKTPWNKGFKGVSKDTSLKMSMKKLGKRPSNYKIPMSEDQRIKLSCLNQGIELDDFTEFKTLQNRLERAKFYELKLHIQCFKKANYTCDKCNVRGTTLHAHHLNSWAFFKDQRYDLDNLVCLCDSCHKDFHIKFGNGKANPNTKSQYDLFKDPTLSKKRIIILTGAPASGKSWVGSQLKKFTIIDSDVIPKKELVKSCECVQNVVLTLTIGVSTFIKNNPQFDCKLVVIVEDQKTIIDRMLLRNGKVTKTIDRRIERMQQLANNAIFSGTAQEALDYLNSTAYF